MAVPRQLGAGRFEVRRCLGRGGMGAVYEAYDRQTGETLAIKLLADVDAQRLFRFKREFRALSDLVHPNLARLYELIADGDRWLITMELIDGADLYAHVTRRDADGTDPSVRRPGEHRFDEERLRACLPQLAAGLGHLHTAGRVHRDLKPSNIMVDRSGRVVILDFGLVATADARSSVSGQDVVGTAAYMAPEQATQAPVTPAADWYAVGTVLYEVLAGVLPFEGGPLDQLLQKTQRDPEPPSRRAPASVAIPADLDALVMALLVRDPDKRAAGREVAEAGGGRSAASAASPVVAPAPATAGPLVGRAGELDALRAVVAATAEGHAAAALVIGESGVGKSMLVRELSRIIAANPRAIVLAGRCYERETVPYRAFDGVIDDLSGVLARMDADSPDIPLPRDIGALARIFPVLWRAPAVAKIAHRETGQQQDQRLRAVGALRRLLDRFADRGPMLIVIDDLQWADADSLGLLSELLRDDGPAVALVATVRASGDDLPPALAAAVERIAGLELIHIDALPAAEARALAVRLWSEIGGGRPIDLGEVVRETGGHPLFLDVMLRHLADGGGAAPPDERSESSGGGGPAGSAGGAGDRPRGINLDAALSARAAALSDDDRRLLEVVAVAGAPLDRRVAADAAGLDRKDVAARVDTLVAARLVASRDEAIESYHDRVREAVIAGLGDRAAGVHRALASSLERLSAADPVVLVRHWEAAGETERAAELAVGAAERAERALAFDQAARLYDIALRGKQLTAAQREALEIRRAEALGDAGQALDAARSFLAMAERGGAQTRLDLRRRAAELFLRHGHLDEGLATLESVLSEVGLHLPATPRRALLKLVWNRALLGLGGLRFNERDELSASARDLLTVDTYRTVGLSMSMVHPVMANYFTTAGLRLALRLGIPDRIGPLLAFEALFKAVVGLPGKARAIEAAELYQRLERSGDESYMAGLHAAARGGIAYFSGEFPDAIEWMRKAEAFLRDQPAGKTWELTNVRVFMLLALRCLGECAELTDLVRAFLRDAERRGDRYAETTLTRGLNLVWLVRDDVAGARRALARRSWSPPSGIFHVQHWYEVRAEAETALYTNELLAHADTILEGIERSEKALLGRVVSIGSENQWIRGRIGLARAAKGDAAGIGVTEKAIAALDRRRESYALIWAGLLRAGIALIRGDRAAAATRLRDAEVAAVTAHTALMRASIALRRGQLLGGEEGAAVAAEATDWMTRQGVRAPDRMARVWCPGIGGS